MKHLKSRFGNARLTSLMHLLVKNHSKENKALKKLQTYHTSKNLPQTRGLQPRPELAVGEEHL